METAPLFDAIMDAPKGGVAHWIRTEDGVRLRVAYWTGPKARATVLLFPGRTEYIEKYGETARELLARDFATVAIDWRGQGLADRLLPDGAKGHVGHFDDYQKDVAALLTHVAALGLTPDYILSHSMGGCIALQALMDGLPVRAAAFSAPMWGLAMAPGMRPVAWLMGQIGRIGNLGNAIVPGQSRVTYVLREAFERNTLTHDRRMWEKFRDQARAHGELTLGGPTLRWLGTALSTCRELAEKPSPDVPTVTFLCSEEAIVDKGRITRRMAEWGNGTLHVLQKAHHEPMMETPAIRKDVYDTIAAHFDAHPA